MKTDAIAIANYFVDKSIQDKTAPYQLTLLRLVKYVYIAYGFALAVLNRVIIDKRFDAVEGWKFALGNCTHRNDGRTVIFVKANDMEQEKKLAIPEGWGFDRVENGEVILKKVVEELPKTWADCINKPGGGNRLGEMEGLNCHSSLNAVPKGMRKPMLALCQLLVCRNAWWKRLGWKPDWKNQEQKKYCIGFIKGRIDTTTDEGSNRILAFPTPEVQGEFLRTFRDLIEEAKELL